MRRTPPNPGGESPTAGAGPPRRRPLLALALLLAPVAGLAAVPLYDRTQPRLLSIPFFYWYQLAWVPLGIGCLALAARLLPLTSSKGSS